MLLVSNISVINSDKYNQLWSFLKDTIVRTVVNGVRHRSTLTQDTLIDISQSPEMNGSVFLYTDYTSSVWPTESNTRSPSQELSYTDGYDIVQLGYATLCPQYRQRMHIGAN